MANVIKHKRGSGSDPVASDLVVGEVAIRTDVGKLFTKMDNGSVAEIAGGGSDIAINTLSSSSGTGGGSATFNGSAYRFTLSAPPSVSAQQLLVSINGVIQKPVAGTGKPSEGFAVDGTDIILGDAPATGSDFFILTFKSLGVSEPADNSVTSAKIVDGTIVNADINANAAIDVSKLSGVLPLAGGTLVGNLSITREQPVILFNDSTDNPDYYIGNIDGTFRIQDTTNAVTRFRVNTNGDVDIAGKLLLGTTTEGVSTADDLTIATSGNTGITIRSGTSSNGNIFFADGTTGNAEFEGFIQYDHSSNYMRFATGATERLRIDSEGKMGLGTASPSNIIHATGSNSGTGYQFINTHATDGFGVRIAGGGTTADRYALRVDDAAANERFRVNANGNVGIGTSIPSTPLHISTNTDGTSDLITLHADADGTGANNGIASIKFMGNSNHAAFIKGGHTTFGDTILTFHTDAHDSGINPEERMRIDSSGSLLLGVTSAHPVASNHDPKFLVSGTSFASCLVSQQRFENNAAGPTLVFAKSRSGTQNSHTIVQDGDELGKIRFYGSDGNDFQNYGAEMAIQVDGTPGNNDMPGRFIFKTTKDGNSSSSERMAIMSKGRINTLIDDTDSVGVLHKRHQGSNSHNFFEIRSSGTSLLSGGTLQFAIETDGDVKNTNNSYGSLSDIKLKENIVDAKSQWDDIKALKIRNYNFKSELDYGTYTQIGLIAQEVEETSPGLVVDNIDRDDEGKDLGTTTKALRYSVLHIKALKALQEAMAKIETLEAKVATLEAA